MITQLMRPQKFSELAGQELNRKILRAIVRNPEQSPRSIVLHGSFGCGKTSSARLLARALNCLDLQPGEEPCGKCERCLEDINSTYYYQEYDAAIVGNVDSIKELRDTFFYRVDGGWKIIVLDEAHMISKQAQAALLKVVEETPKSVIFVFATTDPQNLLPTIKSRSLELRFETVSVAETVENLKSIANRLEIEISADLLELIAVRSGGHMRDAHMLLDKYVLLGEEDFRATVESASGCFLEYFIAIAKKSQKEALEALNSLGKYPLSSIKADYEQCLLDIIKQYIGIETYGKHKELVSLMGGNVLKFVKLAMSSWVIEAFRSDYQFQTAMLILYQMMNRVVSSSADTQNNSVYGRSVKR